MIPAPKLATGLGVVCLLLLIACGFLKMEVAEAERDAEAARRTLAEERGKAERTAREATEEFRAREGEVVGALFTLAQARADDMRELDEARTDLLRRWPTGRLRQLAPAPARDGGVSTVPGAPGTDARTCEERLAGARESYLRGLEAYGTLVDGTRGLVESGFAGAVIEAELREARGALRACQTLTGAGRGPGAPDRDREPGGSPRRGPKRAREGPRRGRRSPGWGRGSRGVA